jgi:hypothetical protein
MKKIILVAIVATLLCNQIWGVWTEIELTKYGKEQKESWRFPWNSEGDEKENTDRLKGYHVDDIAIAKEKDGENYYMLTSLFKGKKRYLLQESFDLTNPKTAMDNSTRGGSGLAKIFQKTAIYGYDHILAGTDDNDIFYTFKTKPDPKATFKFENAHKGNGGAIDQLRIGTATLNNEQMPCIASSSGWPTLRIRPAWTAKQTDADKQGEILEYSNAYLLDFNKNTLVYAKETPKKGFGGFFSKITGHTEVEIRVQFNVDFKNWQHPESNDTNEKNFATISPILKIHKKDIFTKLFASAQNDMAIIVRPIADGRLSYNIIRYNRKKSDAENQRSGNLVKLDLGEDPQVQKIYLLRTEAPLTDDDLGKKIQAHLVIVTNTGIAIFKIGPSHPIEDQGTVIYVRHIEKHAKTLNIQASCMNGNQLFIMHENTDGNKRLFTIDVGELTEKGKASTE